MPTQQGMNGLSDADVSFLKDFVREEKQKRHNSPYRHEDQDTHQAPETYVAMPVHCLGLPGLARYGSTGTSTSTASTGTSTYTGTGSGTTRCPGEPARPGDVPGAGLCDIYRMNSKTGTLQPVGTRQMVYNLSSSSIAKDWVLVTRDKYGRWFPIVTSVNTTKIIEFVLTTVFCASATHQGTGTSQSSGTGSRSGTDFAAVQAYVVAYGMALGTICGGELPRGILRLYDDECCWLTGNLQIFTGVRGKAVFMKRSFQTFVGCDGIQRPDCYWSIINLCGIGMNCV